MINKQITSKKILKDIALQKERLTIFKQKDVWFSDNALISALCVFKVYFFLKIKDKDLTLIFQSRYIIVIGKKPSKESIRNFLLKVKIMRDLLKKVKKMNRNTLIFIYPIQIKKSISFDFLFLAYNKKAEIDLMGINIINKKENDEFWNKEMPKDGSKHILTTYRALGERFAHYVAQNLKTNVINLSNVLFLPEIKFNLDSHFFNPKFWDLYDLTNEVSITSMVTGEGVFKIQNSLDLAFENIDVKATEGWIKKYYTQYDDNYEKNILKLRKN